MKDYLRDMVARRKRGEDCGIGSYCTANELVIEACMQRAQRDRQVVLMEATANQVNQFGGYTGMRPSDFRDFVYGIADRIGFAREDILLGGDHLGPLTWQNESETEAMVQYTLFNEKRGIGVNVGYNGADLPFFCQWKMLGKGEYVMARNSSITSRS